MARQSLRRSDHWEYEFCLVFDPTGGVRLTRTAPSLGRNERAMRATARLPHALFETPSLRAEITVTDSVSPLPVIDLRAGGAALSEALGCDVVMTLKGPEE